MYCIIDNKSGKYVIGTFRQVVDTVYKWYVKGGILHYKTRDYEAETHDVFINGITDEQTYTVVTNYLFNQLDRFDYIKCKVITND